MTNDCCVTFQTQMNGERPGPQCGLTSLLPMSCRGRAAAFARDLHSRLRNLGTAHDDDTESSWLARDAAAPALAHRPTTSTNQRDLDTFYDFELECESPSSPVDDIDHPFSERSPTEDQEPPFYDVDAETDAKEQAKLLLQQPDKTKNGFRFSTAFYTDSPVKLQPVPRENGHADKRLFSAMTFEGCARQNSQDEIDCSIARPSPVLDNERLCLPLASCVSTGDSDSEFESAKSDLNDETFQIENNLEIEVTPSVENLSLSEVETVLDEENEIEVKEQTPCNCTEILKDEQEPVITRDVLVERELILSVIEESAETDVESTSLGAEVEEEKETEQNEVEDNFPQRVRRCSSLKTGKTPPGTPGRKKIVRFADVLGLDLADVKTFMDEIPVIPKSAYDDLTGCDVQNSPPARAVPRLGALTLVPLFQLPADLTTKLETLNCCLESARVCDGVHVTVCGSVRVRNLDFHKTVHVRYSMNRWKTYTDLQANYVPGSCDGFSDRFQFVLYAPAISSGQRLEIAVRFQCKGQQLWDNNSGANYCFDCLALGAVAGAAAPASSGPLHPTVDWHPSFY